MPRLLHNGQNTEALGFYVFGATLHSPASRAITSLPVIDRAGALIVPRIATAPHLLQLAGALLTSANTAAARVTAEHVLRDRLLSGMATWTYVDDVTPPRYLTGVASEPSVTPRGGSGVHPYSAVASDIAVTVSCQEAFWQATEPTIRAIPAAATRYDLPLGSAPSAFVLRIMGAATNPVVTYRTAGGTVVWTLTFTVTLVATNDYLELDGTTGRIWKYASGVKTDGIALLTGGQQDWGVRGLDPQDGDSTTSAWPTIELSAGTGELSWRKAWL
jgi:hypothetical protein